MAGFRVITAADGAAALNQFREHSADCVVLDVVMPGMSGFDVCSALRGMADCSHVPILMQTSLDDMESVIAHITREPRISRPKASIRCCSRSVSIPGAGQTDSGPIA